MANTSKKFGEEIKRLRLEKNLGVREFAKMIIKDDGEPISPSYLIDIEKNNRIPSGDIVEKIAEVLNYDPANLLSLAQKISPGTEKHLKEEPAIGKLLRKAKETGFDNWKMVEKLIEDEDKKKKHEKNP